MTMDCEGSDCQRTEWYSIGDMILCDRCGIWTCPDCGKAGIGIGTRWSTVADRVGLCVDCQVDIAVHSDHMEG